MKYEVPQRVLCYWNVSPTKRKLYNREHISDQNTLPTIYYWIWPILSRFETEDLKIHFFLRFRDLKTSFLLKFLPHISDILDWRSESRIWVDSKHVYMCSSQVFLDDRGAFLYLTAQIPKLSLFCCNNFFYLFYSISYFALHVTLDTRIHILNSSIKYSGKWKLYRTQKINYMRISI